jgi:hypothetical protein
VKITTNSKVFNLAITDAKEEEVVFCVGEQGSTVWLKARLGFNISQ